IRLTAQLFLGRSLGVASVLHENRFNSRTVNQDEARYLASRTSWSETVNRKPPGHCAIGGRDDPGTHLGTIPELRSACPRFPIMLDTGFRVLPGLCTFSRADPWATCAAAFCVFLRNPCKLLKTLGWLCIEFYALVPLFQRSVSIDRSMHDFYWVFA